MAKLLTARPTTTREQTTTPQVLTLSEVKREELARVLRAQPVAPQQLAVLKRAAGAQLVAQSESPLANVSLGSLLLFAGIGTAGGALISKLLGKSALAGAAVGGVTAGVGSVVTGIAGIGDENSLGSLLVVAPTDDTGQGGLTVGLLRANDITMRRAAATGSARDILSASPRAVILTQEKLDEPPGWLAAVIAHGGAIQAATMEYIGNHSNQFWPHLKVEPPKTSIGSWTRNRTSGSLFTNRFMEWPSPVFPRCRPPFVTLDYYGRKSFQPSHQTAWGAAQMPESMGHPVHHATWYAYRESDIHDYISADDDYLLSDRHLERVAEHDEDFFSKGTFSSPIRPAENVRKWIREYEENANWPFKRWKLRPDHYYDAMDRLFKRLGIPKSDYFYPDQTLQAVELPGGGGFDPGGGMGPGLSEARPIRHYPAITSPPAYWNQKSSYRKLWLQRLDTWYRNSNWLVWAAEMVRLHSDGWNDNPSTEWKDHCVLWGVGTPDGDLRSQRENFGKWYKKDENSPYWLGYSKSYVKQILQAVMRHTPPPVDPRFQGNQIAPEGSSRMMMDIPEGAGSMRPPIYADKFGRERAIQIARSAGTFNIYSAMVQVAASLCSQGIGNAVVGAIGSTVIATTVSEMIQNLYRTVSEGKWLSGGDVVAMVGEFATAFVEYAGEDAAAALLQELNAQGVNIDTSALTEQFQQHLDAPGVRSMLERIQYQYNSLRTTDHWDYLDQAYAGMLSDLNSKDRWDIPGT